MICYIIHYIGFSLLSFFLLYRLFVMNSDAKFSVFATFFFAAVFSCAILVSPIVWPLPFPAIDRVEPEFARSILSIVFALTIYKTNKRWENFVPEEHRK